jgi:hypothetical protein
MKLPTGLLRLTGALLAVPALAVAARAAGNIDLPARRQLVVETAERLTRPAVPAPLPPDLKSMFNPPRFDQADVDERPAGPAAPSGPASARELLETIAARIPPTGTMTDLSGETLLTFGTKKVRRGDVIGVEYNGQTYDLELVAIDRTTFTLRYRGEETTRPIKPTK